MSKLKIAIIGSGSTYTPELIEGIIKRKGGSARQRARADGHRRA
ncbi:hypothetical protein [Cohnella rhizosphaerae]|uniref:6-phospho-beta-glucosidase n=1 Tax=Cohnella rhizosphaerae TaxID=1457232 RepID=A0A9X4QRY9_9BACL|nr:hypothetical protein [Cohnella rhizosphaerae]MDG0809561.1 hypothetical protein [Cohnella rhizosphaerae]